MIQTLLGRLAAGEALTIDEADAAMSEIMDGRATPAQIAAFLTVLRMRGETPDEIAGCARAMRRRAVRLDPGPGPILDTCGTGGDGRGTFNFSTLAALVAAACGARVAKHGNRAATSRCGSADLLEALGARIQNPPEKLARMIREVGLAYLHAPDFHPAMRHAAPVRRELGFRTLFNLLGPLCNPAGADVQTLGVFSPRLCRPLAEVLRTLGTRRAFVFHGHGGLDELSPSGPNLVVELREGRIEEMTLDPSDLGLPAVPLEGLAGGTPAENADIARRVLAGARGPHRDAVLLNAAVALMAAGLADAPQEGVRRAADAVDSGAARRKLDEFISATRS